MSSSLQCALPDPIKPKFDAGGHNWGGKKILCLPCLCKIPDKYSPLIRKYMCLALSWYLHSHTITFIRRKQMIDTYIRTCIAIHGHDGDHEERERGYLEPIALSLAVKTLLPSSADTDVWFTTYGPHQRSVNDLSTGYVCSLVHSNEGLSRRNRSTHMNRSCRLAKDTRSAVDTVH